MSANEPQAAPDGANPDNNHIGGGPLLTPNQIRNNIQNPLLNVRDRLFHTLFYRAALAYARTFPRPLRRFIEFIILIKAISTFFVLVYIHVVFSRTPSTCLLHVKDTWPRDGILRVEIVRNVAKDYTIEQSYAKEEKLKQQGKVEDFTHMIGLLARDGFINIEPSAVDNAKETQPLDSSISSSNNANYTLPDSSTIVPDSLINISTISSTVWSGFELSTENPLTIPDRTGLHGPSIDRTENEAVNLSEIAETVVENKEKLSDTNKLRAGGHDDEYIVEFSLEYGFLRLNPTTRARLKIPVEIVFLDPDKDTCFGDAFSRLILEEFLGYDDLLLASIKTLAEKEDNKGYLRNVVSGEHYRFVSMWMARTSYFAAFFIMIVFAIFSVTEFYNTGHKSAFILICAIGLRVLSCFMN